GGARGGRGPLARGGEPQPPGVEAPGVDDAARRPRLVPQTLHAVDVALCESVRRLPCDLLRERAPAVGEIAADVVEVVPREQPALRNADDHHENRRRDGEPRSESGGRPQPHEIAESAAMAIPFHAANHPRGLVRATSSSCRSAITVTGQVREFTALRGTEGHSSCRSLRDTVRPVSRLLLAAALGLSPGAGCGLRPPGRSTAAPPVAPVALVTEGSAFARPGMRERIGKAVEQISGRPVLLVDPTERDGDRRRALAAKLAKENRELAGYDWREPRCAAETAVLAALASSTDAVDPVTLDAAAHTRPVTPADLRSPAACPRGLGKVLAALRGGE